MNGKIEKEKISQKYLIKLKYLSNKKGFLGVDNKFNFKEKVVIVPFGLEKTVSYGGGTKNGPKEIIKASHQVELYDEELNCEPYKKIGIKTLETFKIDKILPLIECGHIDFGENKVQEAIGKWTDIKKTNLKIRLHMIGKLQTNKVKYAVRIFDYIHSVDSAKLASFALSTE